jgi:S1-C subfamily serine protease
MKNYAKNLLKLTALLVIIIGLGLAPGGDSQAQALPGGSVAVIGVVPTGPAAQAGLQNGDILLQIDDQPLNHPVDLQQYLYTVQPGDTVTLTIQRAEQEQTLTVTLGDHYGRPWLGVTTTFRPAPFTDMQPATGGARLVQITPDSPAEQAGLLPGDVILSIDGEKIVWPRQLTDLIAAHAPGDSVTLTVQSMGQAPRDLTVTLNEHPSHPDTAHLGVTFAPSPMPRHHFPPFQFPHYPPWSWHFPQPPAMPAPPANDNFFERHVVIQQVMPNSPAEAAGLIPGQVITAVNDHAVTFPAAVVQTVAAHAPGDTITLTITQTGQDAPQTITVTLGENPYQPDRAWLGVTLGRIVRYQYYYEQSPNNYQPGQNNPGNI